MEILEWFKLALLTIFTLMLLVGAWYVVPILTGQIDAIVTYGTITADTATFIKGAFYIGLFGTITMIFVYIGNKIIKNSET